MSKRRSINSSQVAGSRVGSGLWLWRAARILLTTGYWLLTTPAWATFPVVQDADTTTGCETNSSSWTLTYPANITSDDLLLSFLGSDGNPTTTWPTDWLKIVENANGTAVRLVVARRFATGSESGNFSVTFSAGESGCWRVLRITGAHASTEPEASAITGTTSQFPNPLVLDPANWDVEDTLWFAAYAADNGATDATAYPANYTNGSTQAGGGGGGSGLGTARRELRAASENPANFTTDTSEEWTAVTIAVRPPVPGPPSRNRAVVISMAMACFVWRLRCRS